MTGLKKQHSRVEVYFSPYFFVISKIQDEMAFIVLSVLFLQK